MLRECLHSQVLGDAIASKQANNNPFSQPLSSINPAFAQHFGGLEVESFHHHLSRLDDLDQFLISDQCINCHDATYTNAAEANMLIDKANTDGQVKINASSYD